MNVTVTQLSSPNVNAPSTEITRANDRIESVVAQVTPTLPSAKVDLTYPADHAPVTSLKGAVMYSVDVRNMDQVHAETTKLTEQLKVTLPAMQSLWDQFRNDLEKTHPALAAMDFGFSLDADGNFVVLERSDELSDHDKRLLTEALNGADSFKMLANEFARLTMGYVKADYVSNGLGKFDLNMKNFHSTIDIERVLDLEIKGEARWNATWYNQVWHKGVERTDYKSTIVL